MAPEPPQEKKPTTYKPEEQKLYNIVMTALEDEEDGTLKEDVANYIVLQFNSESVLGHMEWAHYRELLGNSIHGLLVLVYIKNYTPDLEKRDPLFLSARNLISLLATRALEGKGYDLSIEEIKARQTINVQR